MRRRGRYAQRIKPVILPRRPLRPAAFAGTAVICGSRRIYWLFKNMFKSGGTNGKILFSIPSARKNNMLRKTVLGVVAGSIAASAFAQTTTNIQAPSSNSAYAQDARGVILRNPHGLCWRTGYWDAAASVIGCDGALVPPIAKPTAPAIVPPPQMTAQAPVTPSTPKRCDFTVTLGGDDAFGFDKAALSGGAKKRIDDEVLSKFASCASVESIFVSGHTDRLGSQQYNQRLSEKRADLVAAYLTQTNAPVSVQTLGAGKTQPIKSCDEKLPRKQLIECLSPNRRVVIEVRGIAR